MSRYLGVEASTDQLDSRTALHWFRTETAAQKWLDEWDDPLAYGDPDGARNWHRRLRCVVVLPARWRIPHDRVKARRKSWASSVYAESFETAAAVIASVDAEDILYPHSRAARADA